MTTKGKAVAQRYKRCVRGKRGKRGWACAASASKGLGSLTPLARSAEKERECQILAQRTYADCMADKGRYGVGISKMDRWLCNKIADGAKRRCMGRKGPRRR